MILLPYLRSGELQRLPMVTSKTRVSISLKLTVFLIVWTAGTLAAVAAFYAGVEREAGTHNRIFSYLTNEAKAIHRLLDAPAPLGAAGRERFRQMAESVDGAMKALRTGGRVAGETTNAIPDEHRQMLTDAGARWTPTHRGLIAVAASSEPDETAARQSLHKVYPNWQAALVRLEGALIRRGETIRTHTRNTLTVIALANAVLLAIVLLLVRRFITKPVAAVQAAASRIASGDFSCTVPVSGSDEISELAAEFNLMSRQLQETMSALRNSAEALACSNRELEEYAYAAAHDLQEPSRTVSLYAQLLRRRCELPAEGAQLTEQIEASAQRMLRIVNDLLLHSRSVHEPARSTPTDANRAAAEALAHHSELVRTSDAAVEIGDLPPVTASGPDLELVFRNLIGNSLKYRSTAAPVIRVSASSDGNRCTFRVSDNGLGIAREYHEQVFGLFKRLHGNAIPGTGVGLAVTRKLIEKHGGRIWIESEEGQGATFLFELPAVRMASTATTST